MICLENIDTTNQQLYNPIRIGNIYGEDKGTGFAGNIYDSSGISPTVNTAQGGNRQVMTVDNKKIKIRKLTPTECFRLMNFNDEDVNKSRAMGVSDSSLYKQAGNSIVCNCIELLTEHLYKSQYNSNFECVDEMILNCKTNLPFDKFGVIDRNIDNNTEFDPDFI